ncbi:MAG: hypothetical protein F6K25_04450 [Okeania sp. SIO2G4]|nr:MULTISPECIES: hypothetical protein [unclassified Okeania]NEP71591.1 hypothetical protein [Okeania sp. SIO2G5]NEP92563.1 hypothetical protein [Okeania sp. SIO2F5]NEQ90023.1 hypothetical protein [Okeania sp. SIO2G4]
MTVYLITEQHYQNNWVAQPHLLRRNILETLLKSPTSPPPEGEGRGVG